jgi:hypothetical protein
VTGGCVGRAVPGRGLAGTVGGMEVAVNCIKVPVGCGMGLGDDPNCTDMSQARITIRNREKRNTFFMLDSPSSSILARPGKIFPCQQLSSGLVKRTVSPAGFPSTMTTSIG